MEEFFLSRKEITDKCNESIIIMLFVTKLSIKDAIRQEHNPLKELINIKEYSIEEYGKSEFIIVKK